jgi:hypothetical protein
MPAISGSAIRAPMWLRLGPLTPRSRDSPGVAAIAHPALAGVSATARAWRTQLASLVPVVNENTVWNDVPDEPAATELELRARVTWLSRQMDFWCTLQHDMVPSSGGGNWVARIWHRHRLRGTT